jgi:hypothetical protein
MRNQPSAMGSKDGSNEMETADWDRDADISFRGIRLSVAEVKFYQRNEM